MSWTPPPRDSIPARRLVGGPCKFKEAYCFTSQLLGTRGKNLFGNGLASNIVTAVQLRCRTLAGMRGRADVSVHPTCEVFIAENVDAADQAKDVSMLRLETKMFNGWRVLQDGHARRQEFF